jgi:type VI secretion system protein ImpM
LVAELPRQLSLLSVASATAPFFESLEQLVVDTLQSEPVDFETFDARVVDLGYDLEVACKPRPLSLHPEAGDVLAAAGESGVHLPIGSPDQIGLAFEQLLSHRLSAVYRPLALWWTAGSSNVEPSCLIVRGLPPPSTFACLLEGSWAHHHWRSVAADVEGVDPYDLALLDRTPRLQYRSAAATDVGRVREINQDAFLERPESGIWVVADGLGGHTDGHVASRMVCDALADFDVPGSVGDTVAAARERLVQVNDQLLRNSARSLLADRIGSTLVALIVRGAECAVLWVGDSRVYRWREGRLQQLTRDHSVAAESLLPVTRAESHMVTRAVGVASALSVDVHLDQVRAGDRYLLCSDGLIRVVADADIQERMGTPDVADAVEELMKAALEGGAPDNVTVLIAEATSETSEDDATQPG